jgi:hypothetical protein
MPKANADSVSYPGVDGEPIITQREDFEPSMPLVFEVQKPEQPDNDVPVEGTARNEENRRETSGSGPSSASNSTEPTEAEKKKAEEAGGESESAGNNSSPSARTNVSSKPNSSRKTATR